MSNSENIKIVDFNTYCKKCRNKKLKESEKPCYECLAEPSRQYSNKPLRFEEDTSRK